MTKINYKKTGRLSFFSLVLFLLFIPLFSSHAAFSETINYQGKLMDDAGDLVADGSYNMRFRLCADDACASVLYDESWIGSDKVAVTNGLFSVLIGSVSSTLGLVDFNQDIYLEVSVGGTGAPSWETLTPRKKLAAVPNAFNAQKFDGLTTSSIAVLDRANTFTSVGAWNNGGGDFVNIGDFYNNYSLHVSSTSNYPAIFETNVGIGTTNPMAKLHIQGGEYPDANIFVHSTASTTGGTITLMSDSDYDTAFDNRMHFGKWSNSGWSPRQSFITNVGTSSLHFYQITNLDDWDPDVDADNSSLVAMTIDHNKRIGIGDATPDTNLDLSFNVNGNTGGMIIENTSTGTNATAELKFFNDSGQVGSIFSTGGNYNLVPGYANDFGVLSVADSDLLIGNLGDSDSISFINGIGNAPTLIIRDEGVGIGTTTPQTALHVLGTSTLEKVVMGYGSVIGQNDNYITFDNFDLNGSFAPYQSTYAYDVESSSTIKFLNGFEWGLALTNNFSNSEELSIFSIANDYSSSTDTHNLVFGELVDSIVSSTNFIFNGNLSVAGTVSGVGLEVENGLSFSGSLQKMADNLELPHKLRNLYIADDYAYAIGYATNSVDSFRIIDISNPSNPRVVGGAGLTGLPLSDGKRVWASGNYAYLLYNATGGITNPFRILDISNKSNPVIIGGEDLDLTGLMGSGGQPFYVSGKYAYILGNETMHVVDISNPYNPRLISSLSGVGYSNWDIKVVGDYAYVCARKIIDGQANPLTIVNIKDKANPFIVKEVVIPDLATSTNLCWSLDVSGANVYLGMGTLGNNSSTESFRIVDVSNPNNPVVKGGREIGTNSNPNLSLDENYSGFNYVKVLGNRLYVTTWRSDFLIIDISSSTNPEIISKTSITEPTDDGANAGSLTFDFRGNYVAVGYAPVLPSYPSSTDYFRIFKLPGADIWGGHSDAFSAGSLQVLNNAVFNQRLTVWDSLEVGSGGIYSQGSISVMATNTPSYFGGSVGVGTATPAYKLAVYASNTTDYLIQIATSTNSGIFEIRNDGIARFGGDLVVGGNVGIGTTTPSAKLTVFENDSAKPVAIIGNSYNIAAAGAISVGQSAQAAGPNSVAIGNGANTASSFSIALGSSASALGQSSVALGYSTAESIYSISMGYQALARGNSSIAIGSQSVASGTLSLALGKIEVLGENSLGIGFGDSYLNSYSIAASNTMAIMGGNVGIGTTTPTEKLVVDGNVIISGTGTSTIAGNLQIAQGKVLQVETITAYSPLNVNTGMIISGNVTTTGQSIVNDTVTRSVAAHCSDNSYDNQGDCESNGEAWYSEANHDFTTQLQTGGYGYFPIMDRYFNSGVYGYSTSTNTTGGNIAAVGVYGKASGVGIVGVGDDLGGLFYGGSGQALMTIGGSLFIGSGNFVTDSFSVGESDNPLLTISAITIGLGQYSSPSEFFGVQPSADAGEVATAKFKTWNNVDQLYLDSAGNVGINTTTPQEKFVVAGNAIFTGDVTALSVTETSDVNLKENITDLVYGLDDIMKLRPVNFDYIANGRHSLGFIAQEVKEIIPELVHGNEGSYSLNYSIMTSLLTKGIQQQQEEIENLKVLVGAEGSVSELRVSSDPEFNVDSLKVASAVTFQGTVTVIGEAGFRSKVTFSDHVYFAKDAAGTGTISAGGTSTEVRFSKPYEIAPIITITPKKKLSGINWWVESETPEGFVIAIDPIADQDVQFNWHAVAVLDSSNGEMVEQNPVNQESEPATNSDLENDSVSEEPLTENIPEEPVSSESSESESPSPGDLTEEVSSENVVSSSGGETAEAPPAASESQP